MSADPPQGGFWTSGDAYERYIGRWSRPVADEFLSWLDAPARSRWLDVGCGTGAVAGRVLERERPAIVCGIDPSPAFAAAASARLAGRAVIVSGVAQSLPLRDATFEWLVSGLVLNFVPEPVIAVRDFARVLRQGGTAAVYVWDYAGEMQMLRMFFDAAISLDPGARSHDEGALFKICAPSPMAEVWRSAGFHSVETRAIDVPTVFTDFDDYWQPFLAGRAPAPAYVMSLSEERRKALRDELRHRLPVQPDGSIRLIARAWAVKGIAP